MIIDMHTHAGRPNRTGPVDRAVLATMAPGGVAAAVVSAIADLPMIRRNPETKRLEKVRDPDPGECLATVEDYLASYAATGTRIAREPDEIRAGACPPTGLIQRAPDPADPALVLAVEGCDFLEGDLDRLDALEARGVRSIQLTHYLVNETGDIQTAPPVHGGLTRIGAEAVRRMNRLGIIVDVAHCSEATVRGVAAASTRPILCTHANLKEPGHPDGDHPRYLSPDYARMVVDTGGVIGAWMSVLWAEKLPGLIRHLFRLIDAVGIDHVGIGTDLPAGAARTELPDFSRHQEIAAALRNRGMTEDEVAKVCAGNWLRVFRAVRAR
jgi:membrane dipeptidase